MKKISKINPIASQLRRLGKQVVPDKRRDKEDKRLKKEAKDAKRLRQAGWNEKHKAKICIKKKE